VLITPENTAAEDQVPLLHEQFVAINRQSDIRKRLAFIESALARFERDEFGACEACGEEIPLKRLQAVPWATYCVSCPERIESTDSSAEQEFLLTA
jgi:DnaK suppressor protein